MGMGRGIILRMLPSSNVTRHQAILALSRERILLAGRDTAGSAIPAVEHPHVLVHLRVLVQRDVRVLDVRPLRVHRPPNEQSGVLPL